MGKLKLFAGAFALLAIAYPALVPPTMGVLGIALTAVLAVIGWFLAHLSLTLTLAAGVLLAQLFPGRLGDAARKFGRAWDTAIDAIAPVKA